MHLFVEWPLYPLLPDIIFHCDEEVIQFAKRRNREGLLIELHVIGYAAYDQAVMTIEAALKDFPRQAHHPGIIHACLPTETHCC